MQRYLELYRHVLAYPCHDVPGSAALDKQSKSISMDAGVSQVGRPLNFSSCTTSTLQPSVWRGNLWGADSVMKVLLVNAGDYGRGGGQIAMYRLHLGLKGRGVDSKLLNIRN